MVSKKLFSAVLATLVILSIVAGQPLLSRKRRRARRRRNLRRLIAQIAANSTNLTNFTSLLKKANLTDVLNGPGNFTVFAPDNTAFSKVDAATLAGLQNNTTALRNVAFVSRHPKEVSIKRLHG